MTPASTRPRVICHMMSSLDGRIVTEGWPLSNEKRRAGDVFWLRYGVGST